MKDLHDIIKKPVLSEKSYELLNVRCYTFIVDIHATKTEIKEAVEQVFDVDVEKVRTLRRKGKLKRQGRHEGMTPKTKKAYVTLTEGSNKIPFFENMAQ